MEVFTHTEKYVVKVVNTTGTSEHLEGDHVASAMFNPLLAYPRDVLDPNLAQDRDEGEARLKLLRPALYMAKRDRVGLSDPQGANSIAALVSANDSKHEAIHASLFKGDAPWKPKTRLLAPTTKTLSAQTADYLLPEHMRVNCIPIKASDRVCAVVGFQDKMPPPKLLIDFSEKQIGKEAHVVISRGDAPESLSMTVINDSGMRHEITLTGIKTAVIDKLLSPFPLSSSAYRPLPESPGELPFDLNSAIADFWQRQMRCHVAAAVCAPEDATRPLAFDSIRISRNQSGQLILRATVHPSSIKCACKLHALTPIEERFPAERFVGSEVDLTLSMCGRKRQRTASGLYDACVKCGNATPNVPMLSDICCRGTVASLGCSHFTASGKQRKGRRKSGLWIPDLGLQDHNLLHAQSLMAVASAADSRLSTMIGKRPRSEIEAVCDKADARMERFLGEITRQRVADGDTRSDADMLTLDMAAVDALRDGSYRRHITTTKEEVLAKDNDDGEIVKCTKSDADKGKGPPLELAQTHIGLFRPPLLKRRR